MDNKKVQNWSTIIRSHTKLFDLNLSEIWRYKDLVYMFVIRDFSSVYKQTILGPIWYILQPLLTTIVYAIVLGSVTQMSTDGLPKILFYLSGILFWGYFSNNVLKNSETLLSNATLFGKVYFPRLTAPIATTISGLLALFFQIILFITIYLYYTFHEGLFQPNRTIILFPFLLLVLCLLSMSLGILVSALTIKYRDLKHLINFGIQLALWMTPVLYPLNSVTNTKLLFLIKLNPVSPIIETFRYSVFGTGKFEISGILYTTLFTLITLVISVIAFNKVEKNFIDTI